jgi:hypothetical protein
MARLSKGEREAVLDSVRETLELGYVYDVNLKTRKRHRRNLTEEERDHFQKLLLELLPES